MNKKTIFKKQYNNSLYDRYQLCIIRDGIENGINLEDYIIRDKLIKYNCFQLRQILNGIISNIDISKYTNPIYTWEQMYEIRLGLEKELDVDIYANPEYDWRKMEQIRLDLKKY